LLAARFEKTNMGQPASMRLVFGCLGSFFDPFWVLTFTALSRDNDFDPQTNRWLFATNLVFACAWDSRKSRKACPCA
jgi:hypothetical protein